MHPSNILSTLRRGLGPRAGQELGWVTLWVTLVLYRMGHFPCTTRILRCTLPVRFLHNLGPHLWAGANTRWPRSFGSPARRFWIQCAIILYRQAVILGRTAGILGRPAVVQGRPAVIQGLLGTRGTVRGAGPAGTPHLHV